MYKFYLDYDYTILIKMDDDISFIDTNRFDEFIDYIKLFKKNITIPNLVNHQVSFFYNIKEGLIPNSIIKEKYKNKSSSLELKHYFKDGEQAIKIHKYFLNNIDKFIHNDISPVKLNGQKTSICMFGIEKSSYKNVFSSKAIWGNTKEPEKYLFGFDEPYSYGLLNNYMYSRFVCVHYSFGPQRKSGLDESLLKHYKNLAFKFNINTRIYEYFIKFN